MYKKTIKLSDIKLTSRKYNDQLPNEQKMKRKRKKYAINKILFITIREHTNELLDGYTSYLIAKENNLEYVECSVVSQYEKFLSDPRSFQGRQMKNAILKRDNNRCYICNEKVFTNLEQDNINCATLDHIIPQAKGGQSTMTNLKCCCKFCNNIKADAELTKELVLNIKKEKEYAKRMKLNTIKMYKNIKNQEKYKVS